MHFKSDRRIGGSIRNTDVNDNIWINHQYEYESSATQHENNLPNDHNNVSNDDPINIPNDMSNNAPIDYQIICQITFLLIDQICLILLLMMT